MSKVDDVSYLSHVQYADLTNLNSRWKLYDSVLPKVNIHGEGISSLDLSGIEDILEVGCGAAENLTGLRQRGHKGKLIGCDINPVLFEKAAKDPSLQFYTNSADALPFEANSFDAILAYFMLYHLPDVSKTLEEWNRVLKPDGRIVVSTFSSNNLPKHKRFKQQIANYLQCTPSPQFSSKFNFENAESVLTEHFTIHQTKLYLGRVVLSNPEPYLEFLDTINDFFDPAPPEEQWKIAKALVKSELEKEIELTGTYVDQVKRGLFICTKRQ